MSLHIGIDGSRIAKPFYTGTEHYSFQIIKHLFKVAPHYRYTIYAPKKPTYKLDTGSAEVALKIMPFPKGWTQIRFSVEMLFGQKPDILFIPSHTIPIIHPLKTVATVHDLGFKVFPEYYGNIEYAYQSFGLWQAVRVSSHIITVSEATKKDLIKFTNYPAEKITVIYHGYDREIFRPKRSTEQVPQVFKKYQPYLYTVGRLEAKKNTPGLIRAFRILKEKYKLPHWLVLGGNPGQYGYDKVEAALNELPFKIREKIYLPGYVSNKDNAHWIRFADCLTFVSGFEGFGLPALEAMASGTPVVTSNSSSLPEIVGNAALTVNHTQEETIAEGIYKVVTSKDKKDLLRKRGLERAKFFSWEKSAIQTIRVLEKVAKEN